MTPNKADRGAMEIKHLQFDTIKEGMKRIREEYGPDTIIIDMKERASKGCEIVIAAGEEGPRNAGTVDLMRKLDEITSCVKSLGERVLSIEAEAVARRVDRLSSALRQLFKRMTSNGISARLAYSVVLDVAKEAGNFADDTHVARFFFRRAISQRIPVGRLNGQEGILVLGPSGSGKTSTTKKIAKYMLDRKESVSIIAFDPARKDRYNEYMMFSENTGVPFYFANTEDDVMYVMERDRRKKIIDMPSEAQLQKRIADRLKDLQKLVLAPAWVREAKIRQYCDQFNRMGASGFVITKLDEEKTLGHICDYVIDMAKPVYFLTTGIDICNLVEADHDDFYRILLGESLWGSEGREPLTLRAAGEA